MSPACTVSPIPKHGLYCWTQLRDVANSKRIHLNYDTYTAVWTGYFSEAQKAPLHIAGRHGSSTGLPGPSSWHLCCRCHPFGREAAYEKENNRKHETSLTFVFKLYLIAIESLILKKKITFTSIQELEMWHCCTTGSY